jgi:hypothetical protein
MTLAHLFRHQNICGKDVYVVDDHHRAAVQYSEFSADPRPGSTLFCALFSRNPGERDRFDPRKTSFPTTVSSRRD